MKLPNKVITYNESIISKFPLVLNLLKTNNCSISDLYGKVKNNIEGVDEFLDILDSLFALGRIDFNEETRRLYDVK